MRYNIIERNNKLFYEFGHCKCCGKTYGFYKDLSYKFPVFHYLCFGKQQLKPCIHSNTELICQEQKECRLKRIKDFSYHLEQQAKFIWNEMLKDLESESLVGFMIFPSSIVRFIYNYIKNNNKIYINGFKKLSESQGIIIIGLIK